MPSACRPLAGFECGFGLDSLVFSKIGHTRIHATKLCSISHPAFPRPYWVKQSSFTQSFRPQLRTHYGDQNPHLMFYDFFLLSRCRLRRRVKSLPRAGILICHLTSPSVFVWRRLETIVRVWGICTKLLFLSPNIMICSDILVFIRRKPSKI